jgi:hypothetical protein
MVVEKGVGLDYQFGTADTDQPTTPAIFLQRAR